MDEQARKVVVDQVRKLADEVAPQDTQAARTAFDELIATYGLKTVITALRSDLTD